MVWPPKHWLAVIGIVIEFFGVVIAASWIVPTPPLFVDDTYDHVGEEAKRRRTVIMAWIGVALILIGLVLQMIDAWIFD